MAKKHKQQQAQTEPGEEELSLAALLEKELKYAVESNTLARGFWGEVPPRFYKIAKEEFAKWLVNDFMNRQE